MIVSLILLAGLASASIVSVDNLNLLPFNFEYQYRFVFSDLKP